MKRVLLVCSFNFLIITTVESLTSSENLALATSRFNCNFRTGSCGWTNDRMSDDFNWQRGSGRDALQRGSGPNRDHTGGGYYMYIRSRSRGNRTARFLSPPFNIMTKSCFSFWYHMKGRTLGHLEVLISPVFGPTARETVLWNLRGHQANRWLKAFIPITGETLSRQLIIEAFDWERGRSGNIALDDVRMSNQSASCSEVFPSYANPNPSNTSTPQTTLISGISTPVPSMTNVTSSDNATNDSQTFVYNTTTRPLAASSKATSTAATTVSTRVSSTGTKTAPTSSTAINDAKNDIASTSSDTENISDQNQITFYSTTVAQSSSTNTAIGITLGLLAASFLLVALTIYFRKRMQRNSAYNDKCTVVMTRMYPDVTVNTNISFQKLE